MTPKPINMDPPKVKQIIKELKKLPKEKKNETQHDFLAEIEATPRNYNKLNKLIAKKGLFNNFPKELIFLELELSEEEWERELKPKEDEETDQNKNILYYNVKLNTENKDIEIKLKKPKSPVPAEIFSFIKSVDEVQNTINDIYISDRDKNLSYLRSLTGIARVGGTSTYINLAKQHLEQFKKEIILQKGSEIKLKYLKELGLVGAAFMCIFLITLLLLSVFDKGMENHDQTLINGIILLMGSCVGTWLSFGIRKKEILFEDLRLLSGNNRNPLMRMLVLVLIALCFYFMFITDFITVKVGDSFDTSKIQDADKEAFSFLIGFFIGLAETTIGPSLTSRITTFTSKL